MVPFVSRYLLVTAFFLCSLAPIALAQGTADGSTGEGTSVSEQATTSVPTDAVATTSAPSNPAPATPSSEPVQTQLATATVPVETPTSMNFIWIIALVAVASLLSVFGLIFARSAAKTNSDGKCDDIKSLLEQKKKELEEMIKNWPKEKLQEMALEKVATPEMRKAKEAYDTLKEAIGLLQKRYDLCMLSLPSEKRALQGTIVENSLSTPSTLKDVEILKSWQDGTWKLHRVGTDREHALKFAEHLVDGPWYMHFWEPGTDDVLVVFKNKTFDIKRSDTATWQEAIAYGKSLGIPEEQLDFLID